MVLDRLSKVEESVNSSAAHEMRGTMIHSTLRLTIPPRKMAEALGILTPMAERIKVDPGCLGCHLYMDMLEKNVLMFEQLWRSEEDLKHHLRSNEYRCVLLLMEMGLAPPEVRFNVITQTSGFETIELART
jgi:quinol monooxygenase YgiN